MGAAMDMIEMKRKQRIGARLYKDAIIRDKSVHGRRLWEELVSRANKGEEITDEILDELYNKHRREGHERRDRNT